MATLWRSFRGQTQTHTQAQAQMQTPTQDQPLSEKAPQLERPQSWVPGVDTPDHVCGDTPVANNFHFRGTALGGWLVLEPWITPSLFYQFLGAYEKWGNDAPQHVGIDSSTFCTALGKDEANKQLRRHWRTWVTEKEIKNIKYSGADTLRVPVADWMYVPYEPFIGCWDGAREELDRVLDLCKKYDLKVILDIHTMRYSQNGMDNSGKSGQIEWSIERTPVTTGSRDNTTAPAADGATASAAAPSDISAWPDEVPLPAAVQSPKVARFRHWQTQAANWIGTYNVTSKRYDQGINMTNILNSLEVVRAVVRAHRDHPVVVGLEPVNEPWWETPIPWLKHFYWEAYQVVQSEAPHWVTLLHDSFRFYVQIWGNFMVNCPNYAVDVHLYQAWSPPADAASYQDFACLDGLRVHDMEAAGVPVVVGEWSLATDSCAMWLGGFQDNGPGNPRVTCDTVRCPAPYMGPEQPNAPPDPSLGPQDPFGSGGASYVDHGMYPVDRAFDRDDEALQTLAYSKLASYDRGSHGQFFWNFRTELEPRWDFQEAVRRRWLPRVWDADTLAAVAYSCPPGIHRPAGSLPHPGPGPNGSPVAVWVYEHVATLAAAIVGANVALLLCLLARRLRPGTRVGYTKIVRSVAMRDDAPAPTPTSLWRPEPAQAAAFTSSSSSAGSGKGSEKSTNTRPPFLTPERDQRNCKAGAGTESSLLSSGRSGRWPGRGSSTPNETDSLTYSTDSKYTFASQPDPRRHKDSAGNDAGGRGAKIFSLTPVQIQK